MAPAVHLAYLLKSQSYDATSQCVAICQVKNDVGELLDFVEKQTLAHFWHI